MHDYLSWPTDDLAAQTQVIRAMPIVAARVAGKAARERERQRLNKNVTTVLCLCVKPPQRGNDEGMLPMTCCDPLQAECPLDLTEDDCRTLIRLLRNAITPDREPVLPRPESLRVILEKLEFALGG